METKVTNYRAIIRILGIIVLIIGIAETIPLIYAAITGDSSSTEGFALSAAGTIFLAAVVLITVRPGRSRFGAREGYLVVASCWIVASLLGTVPFLTCGYTSSFADAFFESASGFTTTGCTAFENGLHSCRALLLWKAISHWMGGMGILVFVISLLPALGINGQIIARAETPGPVLQKTTVRMSDSARALYITYFSFTVLEFVLLMLSGKMPVYDGVITTLGSISTGGLLVHSSGIAYYDSVYIELVISVFCLLASINFVLYHYLITGKFSYFLKDIELRAYAIIVASSTAICTLGLMYFNNEDFGGSLRDSFFQVVSFASTAGYTRTNYIAWPAICQLILLTLMFIGGCSASTSGSIKVIRVLVMIKMIARGCVRRIHPRSVVAVKVGKGSIPAPVVAAITAFVFTFMTILMGSSLILSLQGLDIETSITSALCMLSNTGATFGIGASIGNFSFFHPLLKVYLAMVMIVGRLELFTVIIIFTPTFWSRHR
ncbi:MAG: TrkH family potassium uptake protein [Eubacteriales bacterium]|nr:TrkH family potassium uptake protein [Eubacteriales bacterium]